MKEKELEDIYKNKEIALEEKYRDKKSTIIHEHKMKSKEIEQDLKNKKIETEQSLKEFQMLACEEIAVKNDYKLISENDYEKKEQELKKIKEQLSELETSFDNKILEKIEIEKMLFCEKSKQDLLTKELNHKAEIADLTAENKQQIKEIEFLNKLILNLTNEVSEQRNLTKEIAKASSKSQICQSFAKEK